MEKVRPWCGQPSDRGRLKNRTTTTTNSLLSRTVWASRYQKGKTSLDLNEARDDGFWDAVTSAGRYANNPYIL